MDQALAQLLAGKKVATEAQYNWGESTLQVHGYLSAEMPPLHLISSARCIVLRKYEVLTISDPNGEMYIVPGGRCEAGEAPLETMAREVLEETGWTVKSPQVTGFIHFHHLTDKPLGYRYPYPDFVQLIYAGSAGDYFPQKREPDAFVAGSRFRPIGEIAELIASDQQIFLRHALLNHRRRAADGA